MGVDKRPERAWKTGNTTHEGFPLLLRTPAGLNYDELQERFPRLLIVKHLLSKALPSGLPDPEYNEGLADLDHHLITTPEALDQGITVLVETFGGKRTYYSYVADNADIKAQELLAKSRFPAQSLTWDVRDNPKWSFIRRYSAEYGF